MKEEVRNSSDVNKFLTFMLGEEEYGVEVLKVQEIRNYETATRIPNTHDYVKGVVNLRGTVVPTIDLRMRFGLRAEYEDTTVTVLVKVKNGTKERTVGMVVDAVSAVTDIADSDKKSAPDVGASIDTEFIEHVATIDGRLVILLDVDHLVNTAIMEELQASNTNELAVEV